MLLLKNFSLDGSELGGKLKLPANVFFEYFFPLLSSSDNKSLFVVDNKTRRTENLLKIFIIYGRCNQGNLLFLRTKQIFNINYSFRILAYLKTGDSSSAVEWIGGGESLHNSNLISASLIIELHVEILDLNTHHETTNYWVESFRLQCNSGSYKDAIRS